MRLFEDQVERPHSLLKFRNLTFEINFDVVVEANITGTEKTSKGTLCLFSCQIKTVVMSFTRSLPVGLLCADS